MHALENKIELNSSHSVEILEILRATDWCKSIQYDPSKDYLYTFYMLSLCRISCHVLFRQVTFHIQLSVHLASNPLTV